MLKLLDVLVQLDHLKNAKASIPNDFSWYKRYANRIMCCLYYCVSLLLLYMLSNMVYTYVMNLYLAIDFSFSLVFFMFCHMLLFLFGKGNCRNYWPHSVISLVSL